MSCRLEWLCLLKELSTKITVILHNFSRKLPLNFKASQVPHCEISFWTCVTTSNFPCNFSSLPVITCHQKNISLGNAIKLWLTVCRKDVILRYFQLERLVEALRDSLPKAELTSPIRNNCAKNSHKRKKNYTGQFFV